jgi:hypothetical protein
MKIKTATGQTVIFVKLGDEANRDSGHYYLNGREISLQLVKKLTEEIRQELTAE